MGTGKRKQALCTNGERKSLQKGIATTRSPKPVGNWQDCEEMCSFLMAISKHLRTQWKEERLLFGSFFQSVHFKASTPITLDLRERRISQWTGHDGTEVLISQKEIKDSNPL